MLDIGGQDMKCIKLKNHSVDTVLLNEACSSGCGSFIENFANSLGYSAEAFAEGAVRPQPGRPRDTVHGVYELQRQAGPEGGRLRRRHLRRPGLFRHKNALFKVIKLADARDLGRHIVVQGGTFYNQAVLRAFEQIAGTRATCPDISGIMGAFGAALIARRRYHGQKTTMLPFRKFRVDLHDDGLHCGGCSNNCMLTVNTFPGGGRHITGNRCEKGLGGASSAEKAQSL